jgi:hypothetical protein
MPSILAHLPPASDCRRLIHSFQTFDLLFRLVHMPSFMRKVDALIATIAAVQGSSPPVRSAGFDARRRADSALAPRPEWDTIRMTEIACVLAAMVCGATIYIHGRTSDAPIQHDPEMHDPRSSEHHLRALLDVVLNMCDAKYTQLPPVEYVYAHLLTSYTYMAGIGGGPQRGWLASGRAYHAALLVGINNEDRTDESTFDRELRRRCWWHTINSRA